MKKFKNFPKGRKKKTKINIPYIFITPVVFKHDLILAKNKPALDAIKLPMLKYAEV